MEASPFGAHEHLRARSLRVAKSAQVCVSLPCARCARVCCCEPRPKPKCQKKSLFSVRPNAAAGPAQENALARRAIVSLAFALCFCPLHAKPCCAKKRDRGPRRRARERGCCRAQKSRTPPPPPRACSAQTRAASGAIVRLSCIQHAGRVRDRRAPGGRPPTRARRRFSRSPPPQRGGRTRRHRHGGAARGDDEPDDPHHGRL